MDPPPTTLAVLQSPPVQTVPLGHWQSLSASRTAPCDVHGPTKKRKIGHGDDDGFLSNISGIYQRLRIQHDWIIVTNLGPVPRLAAAPAPAAKTGRAAQSPWPSIVPAGCVVPCTSRDSPPSLLLCLWAVGCRAASAAWCSVVSSRTHRERTNRKRRKEAFCVLSVEAIQWWRGVEAYRLLDPGCLARILCATWSSQRICHG